MDLNGPKLFFDLDPTVTTTKTGTQQLVIDFENGGIVKIYKS